MFLRYFIPFLLLDINTKKPVARLSQTEHGLLPIVLSAVSERRFINNEDLRVYSAVLLLQNVFRIYKLKMF